MRLIDADAIIYDEREEGVLSVTEYDIDQMPTIDAVMVVRCGDCRFYDDQYCHVNSCYVHSKKYFCVFGETEEMMKKKRGIKC